MTSVCPLPSPSDIQICSLTNNPGSQQPTRRRSRSAELHRTTMTPPRIHDVICRALCHNTRKKTGVVQKNNKKMTGGRCVGNPTEWITFPASATSLSADLESEEKFLFESPKACCRSPVSIKLQSERASTWAAGRAVAGQSFAVAQMKRMPASRCYE